MAISAPKTDFLHRPAAAWLVLALSLLLTALAWLLSERAVQAKAETRFRLQAQEVVSAVSKRMLDETQVSLIAAEMSEAIQQQLVFELPTLIEAVLVSAGEELRAGITETMEMAMRDFIARRKQLRLPLDEQ